MFNKKKQINKTNEVKDWWNKNPFTYSKGEGVGFVDPENQSLEYFEKIERKLRYHASTYQKEGNPLLSNFFQYEQLNNKKVLDIACGSGVFTVEFARQGCDVTAIDLTNYAVKSTLRNLDLRGLKGKAIEMDAQNMDFKDSMFDFVCAQGCLMHMPSMDDALKEIYRVMKKDSSMHAWIYHKGWYFWFGIFFLRGIILLRFLKYGFNLTKLTSRYTDGSLIGGNPHTIFHSKSEAIKRFKNAGFKNIKSYVVFNPIEFESIPTKKINFLRFLPYKAKKFLGKFFGLGLVISATK